MYNLSDGRTSNPIHRYQTRFLNVELEYLTRLLTTEVGHLTRFLNIDIGYSNKGVELHEDRIEDRKYKTKYQ